MEAVWHHNVQRQDHKSPPRCCFHPARKRPSIADSRTDAEANTNANADTNADADTDTDTNPRYVPCHLCSCHR